MKMVDGNAQDCEEVQGCVDAGFGELHRVLAVAGVVDSDSAWKREAAGALVVDRSPGKGPAAS